MALRELGVPIPDDILIDTSRLQDKKLIIQRMMGDQNSPQAQEAAERQRRLEEAQTQQEEAKAAKTAADAGLSQARTGEVQAKTQIMFQGGEGDDGTAAATEQARLQLDAVRTENEMALAQAEFEHKRQLDFMSLGETRRKNDADLQMRSSEMMMKREEQAQKLRADAAAAAQKPQAQQPTKGLR